ncbi:unnamed protein product [Rangifer tarandus platyrhynchus]|uniref:Uncharacterized protein n=2 Tax=Rangifer tarandus platyrhynchus TaxID=3082113 RepID=A0AC59Y4S9_RANTA|nr:unnamed protein product [Rangifer tarandus platyrhynchus]
MLHLQSDLNTLMKPQNTPPCVVSWMDKHFLTTHPPTQRTVRVRQASLWDVDLGFCPEVEILGIGVNLVLCKNCSVSAHLHILAFPYHRVLLGNSPSPCVIARLVCAQDPMAQAVSFSLQSWVLCRAQHVACGCGIPRERPDSAGTNCSEEGTQTFANKGV